MRRCLVLLILGCIQCSVFAQSKSDSLLQRLSLAKPDTQKVWLLHDMARSVMMHGADTMIQYLQDALSLSQDLNFVRGEIASLHRLSQRHQFKGNRKEERSLTIQALNLAQKVQATDWLGLIYNHLGSIYYWELKYDSAYYAYIEAQKIHESLGKTYVIWETKLHLHRLFSTQEEFDKAEAYLEEAYEITKSRGNRMDFGWVLFKRARHYFLRKDWAKYASATEEFLTFKNEGSPSVKSNAFHKTIFSYTDENPQEIIREVEAIIPFHQEKNNYFSLVETYFYLGNMKRQISDNMGAVSDYKKALQAVENLSKPTAKSDIYKAIASAYETENKLDAAFPYLQKYHQMVDSLHGLEVQKNLSELQVKYETAKKDQALAEQALDLEKSVQARRTFTYLSVAGLVLAIVALWFLYFKTKTNRLLTSQKGVIEKALFEKEILLKEIHHRVKNNLQVISSLLNWQSKYIDDHKALQSMQEGRNRVQSMALIHQNLYQSENLTGVEVEGYIDKLGNSLFNSYNIKQDQIQFTSDIAPINLDVDTLIPLGLILNELLSNALKHAFPGGRKGQIEVRLEQRAESLLLEVIDDGVGMDPKKGKNSSFGYKLVEAFAEKLKAQMQIDHTYGTTVRLLIQNFKTV